VIIWLVGQSAVGKTTIGRAAYETWKQRFANTVFIDGDEVREIFKLNDGVDPYSVESRHKIARNYHMLCVWLDRQQINAVCCTISNFQDVLDENRKVLSEYFEVYLHAPMDVLMRRDTKNLYASALKGETKNVVGVDIPFVPPSQPDMVFDNSAEGADYSAVANEILTRANALAD
jgi:adenylylsulfate kinase